MIVVLSLVPWFALLLMVHAHASPRVSFQRCCVAVSTGSAAYAVILDDTRFAQFLPGPSYLVQSPAQLFLLFVRAHSCRYFTLWFA